MNRSRRGLLDCVAAFDGPGERHEGDARVADDVSDACVIEIEDLEHPVGQPGLSRRPADPFCDEWRLLRVLEHDRVAGDERRHQRVDRRQPGVVPRRDDENDTEGLAPNETGEAVARIQLDVGQRLGRQVEHRSPPQQPAAHLSSSVAHRPSHLHRELLSNGIRVLHGELHEAPDHRAAFVEVDLPPRFKGVAGPASTRSTSSAPSSARSKTTLPSTGEIVRKRPSHGP